MEGTARIVKGKLAIVGKGTYHVHGVRFFRQQIKNIEASKLPLKDSTYRTLAQYRAAVAFWDEQKAKKA